MMSFARYLEEQDFTKGIAHDINVALHTLETTLKRLRNPEDWAEKNATHAKRLIDKLNDVTSALSKIK
jgi:hypothetical protein